MSHVKVHGFSIRKIYMCSRISIYTLYFELKLNGTFSVSKKVVGNICTKMCFWILKQVARERRPMYIYAFVDFSKDNGFGPVDWRTT